MVLDMLNETNRKVKRGAEGASRQRQMKTAHLSGGRRLDEQAAKSGNSMLHNNTEKVKRVAVFVDGNNLFHSVYDLKWFDVLWTDLKALGALIANQVSGESKVDYVKLFTARPFDIEGAKIKPALWVAFTDANRAHGDVEKVLGRFERDKTGLHPKEKESDANLAAHLCIDAAQNRFDIAVVITADTDFVGTFRYLTERIPDVQLVLGLPPNPGNTRHSPKLVRRANRHVRISRGLLRRCLLPDLVVDEATGNVYPKPDDITWSAKTRLT